VLGFGLPTVFVPNETPGMDNQAARSLYAEERGVALRATAGDLEAKLRAIIDPDVRGALRRRLRRLKMPNGAAEAADVIRLMCRQRV
jgi:UDP-N-acetylglucosamine:LPS N-acetylglucosamine transferase